MSAPPGRRRNITRPGTIPLPRVLALLCALAIGLTAPGVGSGASAEVVDAPAAPTIDAHTVAAADLTDVRVAHAARVADGGFTRDDAFASSVPFGAAADDREVVPGDLIVTTRDTAALQRFQATSWQSIAGIGFTRAEPLAEQVALLSADPTNVDRIAARLRDDPAVLSVEPNRLHRFTAAPDDPSYPAQWAHQATAIEEAWALSTGSADVVIAIADSGVVASHPDLDGIVDQVDVSTGEVRPGGNDNDACRIGHGTWVAGVVGATGNNGVGVAGVNWDVSILDINTAHPDISCGGPSQAAMVRALALAAERGADVINLSFGAQADACPRSIQVAVDQARAAGTVVVAAAGNWGTTRPVVPASCNGVISVAATGPDDTPAPYSQRNAYVDVAAPGGGQSSMTNDPAVDIITTSHYNNRNRTEDYYAIAGTSFSAPYVTGIAGLMRAVNPDITVEEVESLLTRTALDLGPTGRDDAHGHGLVQGAAVVTAASGESIPPPLPSADFPVESSGTEPEPGESCEGPRPDDGTSRSIRIADERAVTDPVCQAAAVSSFLPDGGVPFAVIARVDDYADALAGSSIGLGVGPLLFTSSSGPLDVRTEAELLRVLDFENRIPTVYIMGGTAAVPATVDQRLSDLGIQPVRVAGDGREATAVQASAEVQALIRDVAFPTRDYAFVAFGRNWPDAVGAGQMAARYGIPILLTNADELHVQTAEELERLDPSRVYVLGGTTVISDDVIEDIRDLGLAVERLAGPGRVDTTLAVSLSYLAELDADAHAGEGELRTPLLVAINMDDNFNDILSASFLGGVGNVSLPMAGDGSIVIDPVREAFCDFGLPVFLIGGDDRIGFVGEQAAVDVAGGGAC